MIPLRIAARIALTVAALAGCGGESEGTSGAAGAGGAAGECAPPNRLVGDACREPGVQDDGCPAGTLGLGDGKCRPAGIPPEMCGEGFVHDGDVGCEPILPAEECPPGLMAVPGDTACRPVMPCAPGKWGDIDIDAMTEHVDGSYLGGGSDGTAATPWTTVGDAIAAATPGATVAVAAGSYAEDVVIQGKPVVLWGVCPDDVEIVGTGAESAAVFVQDQAGGTVVRGLAITGAAIGIALSGSEQVLFDRVRVWDNASRGIDVEDVFGATSCALMGSLVEQNHEVGVFVFSSQATIEATVVRGTQLDARGFLGRGINVRADSGGTPSTVTIMRSVVEKNHEVGVFVAQSEATIEATVVRGTLSNVDGLGGSGIGIQDDTGAHFTATVRSSLIEKNREVGMFVSGAETTIEATVVRGTSPNTLSGGLGISIRESAASGASTATLRSSLIEQNRDVGVLVLGSEVTIEATVVRATLPSADGRFGRGITIEHSPDGGAPSIAAVRSAVIDQNHEIGILAGSASEVTIEGCLVRATLPNADGRFGDGVTVATESGPTTLSVAATRIEDSARAGVSSFGASVSLGDTVVQCAALDLEGEPLAGAPFTFENLGGNVCGCPSAEGECLLETVGIEPPTPVTPVE